MFVLRKISKKCLPVGIYQVVGVHDVSSIYRVPLLLEDQQVVDFLADRLHIPLPTTRPPRFLLKWRELADRSDRMLREVTICLVGKYTKLEDAYASVIKALHHAAMACNHRLDLKVNRLVILFILYCYVLRTVLIAFVCYHLAGHVQHL